MSDASIQTVILCGGRGTRLREYTEAIPKVLVEVGGRPILWHIMKLYAHYGFDDFVLALGYLGDRIKQFFLDYHGWRGRADLEPDVRGVGKLHDEIDRQYLSSEKAASVLGWAPQVLLDDGLQRAVAWFASVLADARSLATVNH